MVVPVFIIIKGSIYLEDRSIITVFIPNDRDSKYIKVKVSDLQREIDKPIITVEIFNTNSQ